jgi:hypothetical protein
VTKVMSVIRTQRCVTSLNTDHASKKSEGKRLFRLPGGVYLHMPVHRPLNENLIWKGNPFNFPAEQKHAHKKETLGMRGTAIRIISIFSPSAS